MATLSVSLVGPLVNFQSPFSAIRRCCTEDVLCWDTVQTLTAACAGNVIDAVHNFERYMNEKLIRERTQLVATSKWLSICSVSTTGLNRRVDKYYNNFVIGK